MHIDCPYCNEGYDVIPRPDDWKGSLRTHVTCPHCQQYYRWKVLPQGPSANQAAVPAFTTSSGIYVNLAEYDCNIADAKRFGKVCADAWNHVPDSARQAILRHWSSTPHAPYVWLLRDRSEWGGKGWAATSPSGLELCVVEEVATAFSDIHLESMLVHEFAHFLFIAVGEQHHCTAAGGDNRMLLCEKLVWDMTAAWAVQTTDAEVWMRQCFQDDGQTLTRRVVPLDFVDAKQQQQSALESALVRVGAYNLPEEYRMFCSN